MYKNKCNVMDISHLTPISTTLMIKMPSGETMIRAIAIPIPSELRSSQDFKYFTIFSLSIRFNYLFNQKITEVVLVVVVVVFVSTGKFWCSSHMDPGSRALADLFRSSRLFPRPDRRAERW